MCIYTTVNSFIVRQNIELEFRMGRCPSPYLHGASRRIKRKSRHSVSARREIRPLFPLNSAEAGQGGGLGGSSGPGAMLSFNLWCTEPLIAGGWLHCRAGIRTRTGTNRTGRCPIRGCGAESPGLSGPGSALQGEGERNRSWHVDFTSGVDGVGRGGPELGERDPLRSPHPPNKVKHFLSVPATPPNP